MKLINIKILFGIAICLLPLLAYSQAPQRDWFSYYSSSMTVPTDMIYDSVHQCIYIAGTTADSIGIGTPGTHKEHNTSTMILPYAIFEGHVNKYRTDAFLIKMSLTGEVLWGTYFGGDEQEHNWGLTVDSNGYVYISGITYSENGIGTAGAFKETVVLVDSAPTGYLARFDPEDGTLDWATYFGGDGEERTILKDVAVDAQNHVYICGSTHALSGIATTGSYQDTPPNTTKNGFIACFDASGERLWGSYFGTSSDTSTIIHALEIDQDRLYLMGRGCYELGFGTPGTYHADPLNIHSGFLAVMDTSGADRIWCTYVTDADAVLGTDDIAIDLSGNIYLVGNTLEATSICTEDAYQPEYGGGWHDYFLMKFDASGNRLWGTYYGGSGKEFPSFYDSDHALNRGYHLIYSPGEDNVYFGSFMSVPYSTDGIATDCGLDLINGNQKGVLSKWTSGGQLVWGSYFDEGIYAMAIGKKNSGAAVPDIYIAARTPYDSLSYGMGMGDESIGDYEFRMLAGRIRQECEDLSITISHSDGWISVSDEGFESYDWYKGSSLIHSGTESSINISDEGSGSYYLVGYRCGCTYTSDTIDVSGVGIDEHIMSNKWQIFPNPTTDQIVIRISDLTQIDQIKDIRIVDIYGRTIIEKLWKGINERSQSIDVRALPAGMYVVHLAGSSQVFVKH